MFLLVVLEKLYYCPYDEGDDDDIDDNHFQHNLIIFYLSDNINICMVMMRRNMAKGYTVA